MTHGTDVLTAADQIGIASMTTGLIAIDDFGIDASIVIAIGGMCVTGGTIATGGPGRIGGIFETGASLTMTIFDVFSANAGAIGFELSAPTTPSTLTELRIIPDGKAS
jgi:hypothetical protein